MLRKLFVILNAILLILLFVSQKPTVYSQPIAIFEDHFNSDTLDPLKWDTSIATSGLRWCAVGSGTDSYVGEWQDPTTDPCNNVSGSLPYGEIISGTGSVSLKSPTGRAFPFILAGPHNNVLPFNGSEDFIFEVRMKYDSIATHGAGVRIQHWESTELSGTNSPFNPDNLVFHVWVDTQTGAPRAKLFDEQITLSDPLGFHTYKVEYIDGVYSLYIDGVLTFEILLPIYAPIQSGLVILPSQAGGSMTGAILL